MILVTGAAGFIGSNFVPDWLAGPDGPIVNLDKLCDIFDNTWRDRIERNYAQCGALR